MCCSPKRTRSVEPIAGLLGDRPALTLRKRACPTPVVLFLGPLENVQMARESCRQPCHPSPRIAIYEGAL